MNTNVFLARAFLELIFRLPILWRIKKSKSSLTENEYMAAVAKGASGIIEKYMKITGSTLNIKGKENIPKEEAVLFVANHQGNFDLSVFLYGIDKPKGYVSKMEASKIPLMSAWMREMRCLFIDRDDLRQSAAIITEGVKLLKNGYSLVVFPEGSRSRGLEVGEFKGGSFKLATKSNVPIIPVSLNGSYKIMEMNKNRVIGGRIDAIIHPPLFTKGLTREETAEIPQKVKEIILNGVKELQS
ncbi:MAG: 1-acyl-sn-glycerol-3-phosphate acyltransferase [Clostridiales bacterium]|jgi:1-acyl-sn-glycerol-3-phosphate acyltransferase|nr:1-acyl-sn-glycerol-3-phosphate acyltransferase [Clostridiales bacterium]